MIVTEVQLEVVELACKETPAKNVKLIQKGENMITGTVKGQRSTFKFVLIPDGGTIQGQANITVDDTNVTLSANGDGTFNADTVATDTATSYNLRYQALSSDGKTQIDKTFNVPFISGEIPATDVDLVQLS